MTSVRHADGLRREIHAASCVLLSTEPEEIRALRTGNHKARAGAGGQYFTTWDTAHGMLRDWACLSLYPLLRLAESNETGLTPPQFVELWQATSHQYSAYLGYSGFESLHQFERRAHALCAIDPDRDTLIALLREIVRYANLLTAWSHHYFPWGIGAELRYADTATPDQTTAAPASLTPQAIDVLAGIDGPHIEIAWEPLGVRARAVLAASLNPELVKDFVAGLPFTTLQEHATVSGESMYAWTPLVSTAPIRHTERICDAPVGRLRFSQATGQKFIVQYGTATEDVASPVLGQIVPDDRAGLTSVGEAAWQNTLDRQHPIWVSVRVL